MAVDEGSRHKLHTRLEEVLGTEEAAVLMEHLPPVGWADVATKRDLDQLAVATKRDLDQQTIAIQRELHLTVDAVKQEFDLKLDGLKQELLATFRSELLHQTRTMMFGLSTSVVAVGGVAIAAARLI